MLLDSHFHLDFLPSQSRKTVLSGLRQKNIEVIAQTLTPTSYREQEKFSGLSLGFHPWNIESASKAEEELKIFRQFLPEVNYLGEIGLDFSPRGLERTSAELQIEVFRSIIESAFELRRPVVCSIHAVRSVTQVLDILQDVGGVQEHRQGSAGLTNGVIPIIHWFSGSSDELTRLIRCGGYLSINPKMLTTRRGRAYIKQIPAERILLETDLPQESQIDSSSTVENIANQQVQTVTAHLCELLTEISHIRGADITDDLTATQAALYRHLNQKDSAVPEK